MHDDKLAAPADRPSGSRHEEDAGHFPTLSIDPFDREFLADPYARHDELRDPAPVVWLERYGCYAVARFEEVKRVLSDPATFCSSRGVGLIDLARENSFRPPSLLLETDPPVHDATRSLMNRIVSLASLKALRPIWHERACALADEVAARREVDAVTEVAETYPMMVFPDTIGLPMEGRGHLLSYASAVFNAFGPRNDVFEEANEGLEPALKWVEEACRRENLSDDGWGAAVHRAGGDAGLSVLQCETLVRSFLSAGVDTTVNGIGNMLFAFSRNPEQWALLREQPSLAKRAFEEALRWESTVQAFFRTTTRDVGIGGGTIPAGSKILVFFAAANRDPRRWEDPLRFDIMRQTSGHVGFGYGVHQCLGQMVARQEGELMIGALVERVARIVPLGAPRRRLNNTLRALSSLPVEMVAA